MPSFIASVPVSHEQVNGLNILCIFTDDIRRNKASGCFKQVSFFCLHLVHHNIPDGRGLPLAVLDEIEIKFVLTGFQVAWNDCHIRTPLQGEGRKIRPSLPAGYW